MDMNDEKIFDNIAEDIKEILYEYIKVESFTYSANEKFSSEFLMNLFKDFPYFQKHPELYGEYEIEDDPFDRSTFWAMVKGEGEDTVVFVHHNDVVGIEDFKTLQYKAFLPDELAESLLEIKDSLSKEVQSDLESNEWLFGRGASDMKGGGAIQIALLKRYSELQDFKGNVILLAVPDEENLSVGMRRAVVLLNDLKKKYNLNYRMMINSESHQRKSYTRGVFSTGSVGKVLPFFYIRGSLSHVGKVFEGLNPLNIMSSIIRKTELNMGFSDLVEDEASPPPTWLYVRDSKTSYDVSMPLSASGCCSVLTLGRNLAQIMQELQEICDYSFNETIRDMNYSWREFAKMTGRERGKLPWESKVYSFREFYNEAKESYGQKFEDEYKNKVDELTIDIRMGDCSIIESNFRLIEFIFDYIDDISPRVIYGLIPPYYPAVANVLMDDLDENQVEIANYLETYANEKFGENYETELFYTGISDLSYASIRDGDSELEALEESMPLYGRFYEIPIHDLEDISMPVINVGPWGKEIHKMTERVYKEDLYKRTPRLVHEAVKYSLDRAK